MLFISYTNIMGKDYQPESHMSPRDKKEIIRLYYRTLKENVPSQVSQRPFHFFLFFTQTVLVKCHLLSEFRRILLE